MASLTSPNILPHNQTSHSTFPVHIESQLYDDDSQNHTETNENIQKYIDTVAELESSKDFDTGSQESQQSEDFNGLCAYLAKCSQFRT